VIEEDVRERVARRDRGQRREGLVRRREHGERTRAREVVDEALRRDGASERGEARVARDGLDRRRKEHAVDHVHDAVGRLDVGRRHVRAAGDRVAAVDRDATRGGDEDRQLRDGGLRASRDARGRHLGEEAVVEEDAAQRVGRRRVDHLEREAGGSNAASLGANTVNAPGLSSTSAIAIGVPPIGTSEARSTAASRMSKSSLATTRSVIVALPSTPVSSVLGPVSVPDGPVSEPMGVAASAPVLLSGQPDSALAPSARTVAKPKRFESELFM
jgi:hypothetical protein